MMWKWSDARWVLTSTRRLGMEASLRVGCFWLLSSGRGEGRILPHQDLTWRVELSGASQHWDH